MDLEVWGEVCATSPIVTLRSRMGCRSLQYDSHKDHGSQRNRNLPPKNSKDPTPGPLKGRILIPAVDGGPERCSGLPWGFPSVVNPSCPNFLILAVGIVPVHKVAQWGLILGSDGL